MRALEETTEVISDAAKAVAAQAFEVVIRMEPRLRSMIRRVCGREVFDEAWSDVVVARAPRVMELYDPTKEVPIEAYFMGTMRWYATKWAGKHFGGGVARRPPSALPESCAAPDEDGAAQAREDVEELLAGLSEYDAWVIRKHALEGYTLDELRPALGLSRSAICHRYNQALVRLKVLADQRERSIAR